MIAHLRGKLMEALPTRVTVDVGGVGYEALIPVSSYERLPPPGGEVLLLTHLAVREDAHVLYGFMTARERDLFRMLIQHVSGVGPKLALNVLSGMSPEAFRAAVASGDVKALSRINGVGKKTAERIVVELRDKMGGAEAMPVKAGRAISGPKYEKLNDAVSALLALGFKQAEALSMIKRAWNALGAEAGVEELVRAALRQGR